jgi:DNA-binding response OmpR family regulator
MLPNRTPSDERASCRRQVLVVEPDPLVRDLVRLGLELEDCRVETVIDPRAALPRARELRPDIVLLDLFTPGVDSLDLLRRLIEQGAEVGWRVIVLSGLGYREVVRAAMAAGAADFVVKPIDLRVLRDKIRHVLPAGPAERPEGDRRIPVSGKAWLADLPRLRPGMAGGQEQAAGG